MNEIIIILTAIIPILVIAFITIIASRNIFRYQPPERKTYTQECESEVHLLIKYLDRHINQPGWDIYLYPLKEWIIKNNIVSEIEIIKNKYDGDGNLLNKIEKHMLICNELNKTYQQKNHDYGDSFSVTMKEIGVLSALTRISDKYHRLVSLLCKPKDEQKVLEESIKDTLLDLANYCIMTSMELEETDDEQT